LGDILNIVGFILIAGSAIYLDTLMSSVRKIRVTREIDHDDMEFAWSSLKKIMLISILGILLLTI